MNALAALLGNSPAIQDVRERAQRLLASSSDTRRFPPILIVGETGTGKGLLARAIHDASARRHAPFVDVSAAAIPDSLLESELFGFERGAFTDAREPRVGLFQAAHRGTIFLDEIGLVPVAVQGKLLKVIEERTVRRLGSTRNEVLDVCLITATNEDLGAAIRAHRFRDDLFYRLAVVTLELPPLRERKDDVELLADAFLASTCRDYGLPAKTLAPSARAALTSYRWPGNVRELRNVIERAALLTQAEQITGPMLALPTSDAVGAAAEAGIERVTPLGDLVEALERSHVIEALDRARWNVSRAAAQLGVTRNVLRYRMKQYGLRRQIRQTARAGSRPIEAPQTDVLAWPSSGGGAATPERRRLAFLRVDVAAVETASSGDCRLMEQIVEKARALAGRVEEAGLTHVVIVFGFEPVEDVTRRAAMTALAVQRAAEHAPGPWRRVKIALHVEEATLACIGGALHLDAEVKRRISEVLEGLANRAPANTIAASKTAVLLLDRRFEFAASNGSLRRYRAAPLVVTGRIRRNA